MEGLSLLGTKTGGIWTAEDAMPLSRSAIQWRVTSEEWQRPFEGVYASGGYELSAEQWAIAAVLASGSSRDLRQKSVTRNVAVAGGRSAARVWGLPLIDDNDPATMAHERLLHDVITHRVRTRGRRRAPHSNRTPVPGARVLHRHAFDLDAHDVVRRPSGLWVTTALRTALDCCLLLDEDAAVCLLDQALRTEQFTPAALAASVDRRAGSRGIERIRRLMSLVDARAESVGETLARLRLKPWIPDLEPQVRIRDERGEIMARADLADPKVKLAIEVDGRVGHEGRQMVAKDRRRDRRTEDQGWTTERVTWFELRRQPDEFVIRIRSRHAKLSAAQAA